MKKPLSRSNSPRSKAKSHLGAVSCSELADLLGLTNRRVQQLAAEKVIPREAHGQYSVREAIRGYCAYLGESREAAGKLNPAQERARRDAAAALRLEIQNDISIRKVVLIADVLAVMGKELGIVRQRLLSLASLCASRAPAVMRTQIFELVEDEVNRALRELSDKTDLKNLETQK
jgi:hypothetical protein